MNFVLAHQRFFIAESIFDRRRVDIQVDINPLQFQILPELVTKAVALPGFLVFQLRFSLGGAHIEQEKNTEVVAMMFSSDLVQSVYKLNQSKNFNPYIVLGYSDIVIDRQFDKFNMRVNWRKLQDLSISGNSQIPL